ncbi:MAG: glycosyltransferase family 4 protein [Candidatus Lindowbacteria bacterium]|nr:glycosyltransferase family 4 protein [Candidatus Lindowbacteria bacterium]
MGYKILVFNWRDIKNPNAGGAEVNFQEIFKRLVRKGHQVTLVSSRHERSFPEEEWIDGIRIIRRGNRHTFNYTVPAVYKREFARTPIDVVLDDLNKIPFYTPLYVRHPLFVMVHHLHGKSTYGDAFLPAALYVHFMERIIPLFYRGIPFVAVSESTKSELVRMGLDPRDIQIIHNGVDHESYTPDNSARAATPLIVCVTRLKKYKGAHILLRAMENVIKEIPDIRLIITGRGDYEPKLNELTKKLHLNGCVEFAGFVTTAQKVDLYRRAQVVVNPSAKEGWGLTVIEANACGTPVIAAEAPGLIESVLHEKTGLLYPHDDIDALSKAIIRLLKDKPLRERFAARSIQWASEFTWEKATQEIEAFMDRVVREQAGRRKRQ